MGIALAPTVPHRLRALFLRFRSVDKLGPGPVTSRSAAPVWVPGAAPDSFILRVTSTEVEPPVLGPPEELFQ